MRIAVNNMTKAGFACMLLAVSAALPAAAQHTAGLKAGMSASNFNGTDVGDPGWRSGFAGGLFFTIALVDELAVQPELFYVQKGATIRRADERFGFAGKVELEYLELPVTLRLSLPLGQSRFALHMLGGPTVAVLSSCEVRGNRLIKACDAEGFDLSVKEIDWNIAGGIGLGMNVQHVAVFVEGRFHAGLGSIDDGSASDVMNHAFLLLAGVSVPIGMRTVIARK